MRRLLQVAALALAAVACGEEPPPPPRPRAIPIERPPIVSPRPTATESAFDLVVVRDGAALLWGQPGRLGGGIKMLPLGALGEVSADERVVVDAETVRAAGGVQFASDTIELTARASGGRLAVAFVRRLEQRLRSYAILGDDHGEAFGRLLELGPVEIDTIGRGHVVIVPSVRGELMVQHTRLPAPCVARPEPRCTPVRVATLGDAPTERSGVNTEIPHPCAAPLLGAAFAGGNWYTAFCRLEDGAPRLQVTGIDPTAHYAHPVELLAGCVAAGLVAIDESVVFVGHCGEDGHERRAVRLRNTGREEEDLGVLEPRIECHAGHPQIRSGGRDGFKMLLAEPADRLEALMPEDIAPRGSRVVWTGEALLVATSLGREVTVNRYQCEEGNLTRTMVP